MNDSAAQIQLHLYLRSVDRTPDELSSLLGISFDECRRIGDPRGRNAANEEWWQAHQRFWTEHWWILHEASTSSYGAAYDDLPMVMDRLMTRVEQNAESFAQLAADGMAQLSVVIQSDGYTGMGFDASIIQRIGRLNLKLDFDLYCERECERVHADSE